MDHPVSPAVAEIIDAIVNDFGTVTIREREAASLFLGDADTKVADLTQHQLLQLAICQFRDLVAEMERVIEGQRHIIQVRSKPKSHR